MPKFTPLLAVATSVIRVFQAPTVSELVSQLVRALTVTLPAAFPNGQIAGFTFSGGGAGQQWASTIYGATIDITETDWLDATFVGAEASEPIGSFDRIIAGLASAAPTFPNIQQAEKQEAGNGGRFGDLLLLRKTVG